MDKKEGYSQKQNSHHGHKPPPAKSQESESAKRGTAAQHDKPEHKPRFYDNWTPEWASVVVQALALIVLGIYTCYTANQWKAVEESNRITRNVAAASQRLTQESNRLTAQGLAEGKRQSQAALSASREQSAEALHESKRQADSTLAASREQAGRALKESKRQSEAAGHLASETLAVSRRQMLESLRAKVFSEGLTIDFGKTPPVLSGNFRNSGALAAERMSWGVSVAWGKIERAATPGMVEYANFIIPGANHPFGTDLALSPEVVEAVEAGTIPLWVWVRIRYGDRLVALYDAETACFTYNARYKWMVYCESAAQPALPLP
jgi:uncharacterized protein YoxC